MILVFHHCGQIFISNMEFLFSWVTNLYICIAQLENIPTKSYDNVPSFCFPINYTFAKIGIIKKYKETAAT